MTTTVTARRTQHNMHDETSLVVVLPRPLGAISCSKQPSTTSSNNNITTTLVLSTTTNKLSSRRQRRRTKIMNKNNACRSSTTMMSRSVSASSTIRMIATIILSLLCFLSSSTATAAVVEMTSSSFVDNHATSSTVTTDEDNDMISSKLTLESRRRNLLRGHADNDDDEEEEVEGRHRLSLTRRYPQNTINHLRSMSKNMDNENNSRIVGGQVVSIENVPNIVQILIDDNFICGGSIIASNFILCAAHCTMYAQKVAIGRQSNSNTSGGSGGGEVIDIIEKVNHPQYGTSGSAYDIAIYKLASPITSIGPEKFVRLNDNPSVPSVGDECIVSGWGLTSQGGSSADELMAVDVNYITNSDCQGPTSAYSPGSITEDMLCAGHLGTGRKDACQGDSGGPLMMDEEGQIFSSSASRVAINTLNQVGVVSWGAGCAQANAPGVYARVSYFQDWIRETTERLDSNTASEIKWSSSSSSTPTKTQEDSSSTSPEPLSVTVQSSSSESVATETASVTDAADPPPPPKTPVVVATIQDAEIPGSAGAAGLVAAATGGSVSQSQKPPSKEEEGCCMTMFMEPVFVGVCSKKGPCNKSSSTCMGESSCLASAPSGTQGLKDVTVIKREYLVNQGLALEDKLAELKALKEAHIAQEEAAIAAALVLEEEATSSMAADVPISATETKPKPNACCWSTQRAADTAVLDRSTRVGCLSHVVKPLCSMSQEACASNDCGNGEFIPDILNYEAPAPPEATAVQETTKPEPEPEPEPETPPKEPAVVADKEPSKSIVIKVTKGTKYTTPSQIVDGAEMGNITYEATFSLQKTLEDGCQDQVDEFYGESNNARTCSWVGSVDRQKVPSANERAQKVNTRCESFGTLCPVSCGFCVHEE